MSTKRIFGGVLTLFIVFILVSCLVEPDTPKLSDVEQATGQTEQASSQTEQEAADQETQKEAKRIEYLTLLKASGNFTLEKEELEDQISLFLNQQEITTNRAISGEKTAVIGSRKLPGFSKQTSSGARSVEDESSETEVYIFDTESTDGTKGYILSSNDLRIGTILAVVDGKTLEDEEEWFSDIIFSGLENYIDYTIDLYNNIDDEAIQELLGKPIPVSDGLMASYGSTSVSNGKGLIHHWYPEVADVISAEWTKTGTYYAQVPVQWHQYYPYNYYVDIANDGILDNDRITGCGPTAIAHLMAFWGHPTTSSLNITIPNTNISTYNYTYNWSLMRNNFTSINSTGAKAVAVLMYEIGHPQRTNSTYGTGVTYTTTGCMITGLRNMGYNTPNSFSSYSYNSVKNSIINQQPVIVIGQTASSETTGGEGHFWIIDGVSTITYTEYLADNTYWYWTNWDFVYCNVGWYDTKYNAWYASGIFDFRYGNQSYIDRSIIPSYYQYSLYILPNVYWP